ncbi:Uma2 family endonuclease [Acaryochloris sp. 'Moss Beach']|uniref:Uma2 family endonuclease n=1 Tax=Acaryochloris sp. 'Moss Beach' TaxID=2740837 RepID=UPI001F1E5007|nr:Uma2 family endonuclease [Acaryochloris sp. 'Moss Beach']UJB70027.1 Uma2 family endonuclease [Acaryochloris sp. 'Moss Beach']
MVASPKQVHLSPEQYLSYEEASPIKHEYRDGEVYAMAGASDAHVTIALNLAVGLRNHIRGSGCRVYLSDMKARVNPNNRFFYPDVMVTCDDRDQATATYKQFPSLIVEVLSASTEAFDRGDKFADYQSLESLQEYVLINAKRQRIECFRRSEGRWVLETYTSTSETFTLSSINYEGEMAAIYEDVIFDPPTPEPSDR